MTSAQHMLWMMDENEAIMGAQYPGVITGKPVGTGGSLGRTGKIVMNLSDRQAQQPVPSDGMVSEGIPSRPDPAVPVPFHLC